MSVLTGARRVRLAVAGAVSLLLLCGTGILAAVTLASAATRYPASLGVHGASTWTVGQSLSVNLKAMTPGTWKLQLWSGTCDSPKARLAVLPSLVVPKTRTLKKTTQLSASLATDLGVILQLRHGRSTLCGVFVVNPRLKYEGECEFCFLSQEGPLAPIPDATNGYTYRPGDTREIVTLDENFQVPAGTTTTFDDKIIIVQPAQRKDLSVFGTLVIEHSLMIWREPEPNLAILRIEKGGTLIIKDSYSFRSGNNVTNWNFEDGSTVQLDHFVGDNWTGIWGSVNYSAVNYSTVHLTLLQMTHDAHVQVSNAHSVWLELIPSAGTYDLTLPAKREWADWTVSGLWPNTSLELRDSYIYERDVSLLPNTHVTVENTPTGFGVGWSMYNDGPGYVDCELRNVGEPGADNEHPEYYADMTWNLPCINSSLTLENSSLEKLWGRTWGFVHLRIYNSNLADPAVDGTSIEEIYDSSISSISANGGGHVYVENSRIDDFIAATGAGSVVYGYGVTGTYNLYTGNGGAYVPLDKPGPPW